MKAFENITGMDHHLKRSQSTGGDDDNLEVAEWSGRLIGDISELVTCFFLVSPRKQNRLLSFT
jgi:hypothetical protein